MRQLYQTCCHGIFYIYHFVQYFSIYTIKLVAMAIFFLPMSNLFLLARMYYSLRPEILVAREVLQKPPLVSPDQTRAPRPPPPTEAAAPAAAASLLPVAAAALLPAVAAPLLPCPPTPRSLAAAASCSAATAAARLPPQAPPFLKKKSSISPATAVLCSGCVGTGVSEPGGAGSGPPPTT